MADPPSPTSLNIPVVTGPRLLASRDELAQAKRIVVKAGTSLVVEQGYPSLKRLSTLVEQIAFLKSEGREVVFVCSGAVGFGRNVARNQMILNSSAADRLHSAAHETGAHKTDALMSHMDIPKSVAAAMGQAHLSHLLQTLFSQLNVTVSEMLLTSYDFKTPGRREATIKTLATCMSLGIVPIINENDAVSSAPSEDLVFDDNDALAGLVAQQLQADLLVLLTDVDGVYDRPPTDPEARIIATYTDDKVEFGPKSDKGRGGMQSKIASAQRAVDAGIPAVVIGTGRHDTTLVDIVAGKTVGTLFVKDPTRLCDSAVSDSAIEEKAVAAKFGGQALQTLPAAKRADVLNAVADAIIAQEAVILAANEQDMKTAEDTNLDPHLRGRLLLTPKKLASVVEGTRQLAQLEDPLSNVLSAMEISDGVTLQKLTAPIGTLLVIFESRPDCLPQIAALALRTGNGVLLKGGKEAEHSNRVLHRVIGDAIEAATDGAVPRGVVGLVTGRAEIAKLLKLDKHIDLVIPRGSNALVSHIQRSTSIPVMGHADGVCHVYLHAEADMAEAEALVIDAKTSYPSACNAAETLLLDAALVANNKYEALLRGLRKAGVKLFGGPIAVDEGIVDTPCQSLHTEYGDLRMTVEVVGSVEAAVAHINEHGSHHTDCIVTSDADAAARFKAGVDSACVFHNVSTRMADGYRFGLGCEVGISTARVHARGPVGVDGLLTSKWVMTDSAAGRCTTVARYSSGEATFTHKKLQ